MVARDLSRLDRPTGGASSYGSLSRETGEEIIAVLGLVLIATGALGVLALVDLLLESTLTGGSELVLLGASLARPPAEDAVLVVAALAVSTTVLLFLGVAALRGHRSKRLEERREQVASLDNGKRLLEYKVEILLAQVRELEGRKAALSGASHSGVLADHVEPMQGERLVVLPDLPPDVDEVGSPEDRPASVEESEPDRPRRWP